MADEPQAPPAGPHIPTFEEICAAGAIQGSLVPVPGWPGAGVRVRALSLTEIEAIRAGAAGPDGEISRDAVNRALVEACLLEPQLTPAQVAVLWTLKAAPLMALISHLSALNGFGDLATAAQMQAVAEAAFRAESAGAVDSALGAAPGPPAA